MSRRLCPYTKEQELCIRDLTNNEYECKGCSNYPEPEKKEAVKE